MSDKEKKLTGARKIIKDCLDTQPGEKVLVLTDTETKSIGDLIARAAYEVTDKVILAIITPRKGHGYSPPKRIVPAMLDSDVIAMPLKFSMTHAEAINKARSKGARIASMGDFNESMLEEGGIEAEFLNIKETVDKIASIFENGKKVTVTTSKGTNIRMDIQNRRGQSEPGLAHEKGKLCSPPNIEANISPVEGSAKGTIIVDGSIPHPDLGVINNPINISVKEGKIIDIDETNNQAKILKTLLCDMEDPNIYNIAELGIGLNPSSEICGNMLEDESAAGTCHIGIGDNTSFGGEVKAKSHIDLILKEATVKVDEIVIQKNGNLKIKD